MAGGNSNFVFLQTLEPQVYRLGLLAERYFVEDPNTCQIKLRQLSELIAQLTASRFGLVVEPSDNFADILRRLKFECSLPREVGELFHSLRISGNQAAHGNADDHASALSGLKLARQLTIWYSRTFYNPADKFGPFVPPAKPAVGTSGKMIEQHYGHVNTIKHADRVLQGLSGWEPMVSDPADSDGTARAVAGAKARLAAQPVHRGRTLRG